MRVEGLDVLFFAAVILVISPVWLYKYPALIDLPQHLSQIKMLESLLFESSFYSDDYEINWFTPYILPNVFLVLLAKVSSPYIAIKLGITFYLVGMSLVGRKLILLFNKSKSLQFIPLCFLYSTAYNWGFVPYLISVAIGAWWLYYFIKHTQVRRTENALMSLLLAMSHAISWGLCVLFIVLIQFSRSRSITSTLRQLFPIFLPFILLVTWVMLSASGEAAVEDVGIFRYYDPSLKVLVFTVVNFMDNHLILGFTKIICLYVALKCFARFSAENKPANIVVLASIAAFIISPSVLLSTGFFSDRLLIYIPIFAPLLIQKVTNERSIVCFLFVAMILSVAAKNAHQSTIENEVNAFEEASNHIQDESRVFYISKYDRTGMALGSIQDLPVFMHFGHWLNFEKFVSVEYSFSYVHNIMVRFINQSKWSSLTSYQYDTFNWVEISEQKYDYLVIRDCDISKDKIDKIEKKSRYLTSRHKDCWLIMSPDFRD